MTFNLPPFASQLLAFGASEVAMKASRLFVVIAAARLLSPADIGMAAAAMATGDILKALTENGIGQRVIAAREEVLASTSKTAHRIFWVWCIGLFALQALVAAVFWLAGGSGLVALLILALAGEYLFMPGGLVQVALAMRTGKMKSVAAIHGGQVVSANAMAVLLALAWPSALALVLPRLLSAPVWLICVRRLHPWTKDRSVPDVPVMPFIRFGWAVLGIEIVKALRLQADKLLVGLLLGAEVLGLYFMAFNAGLSLASSFSVALSVVLFPNLCASDDRSAALRQGMVMSLGCIAPVVLLQSMLAPWYVPLLLGDDWAHISGVVSILCLAAIPTILWTAAAGWMRAEGKPQNELIATACVTAALLVNTVSLAPFGLCAIAWGYLVVASISMTLAARPALSFAFLPQAQRS